MSSTKNFKAIQRKSFNPGNKWSAIVYWSQGKGGNALTNPDGYEYLYDTEEEALAAAQRAIEERRQNAIHETNAALQCKAGED